MLQKSSLYAAFCVQNSSTQVWYVDSGASAHLTKDESWIKDPKSYTGSVKVADDNILNVKSRGDVNLNIMVGKDNSSITVRDVLYVPGVSENLLSVSQIVRKGNRVIFDSTGCKIFNSDNMIIATASLVDGMYILNMPANEAFWQTRQKKR